MAMAKKFRITGVEAVFFKLMRILLVLGLCGVSILLAQSVPNFFQAGDLVSSGQINANFTALIASDTRIESSTVPVGSIRAALLDENAFASAAGDPAVFDASNSKWALADGRNVSGSGYATLSGNANLPDLRGVFLRGINGSRADGLGDPDGNRAAGVYQSDQFRNHNHTNGSFAYLVRIGGPNTTAFLGDSNNTTGTEYDVLNSGAMQAAGGNETRPRNVAVYYYVRIN